MTNEWVNFRLSDVIILIGGGTPKTINPAYWNGDIPWLSVADFNTGYRYVHSAEKTITQKGLEESSTNLLKKGQLIISARGTVGVIAQLGRDMAFNQSCYGITAKEPLTTNNFLYYLISNEVVGLKQITHGGVFETITRDTFDQIVVNVPPLQIQHTIVNILGSLDDKIEINRQMNETLEVMARAIFQSWFVDFNPVRDKAEGGSPGGMDAATAALFPSEFEEIEGMEVPKGWMIASLPEIFEINPQRSIAKDQIAPYLDMQNVPTRGHRPIDWIDRAFSSGTKFVNGDTLLARITPCLENGKTIFVDFLNKAQVGWGSTEYIVLRPKPPLPPEFGYLLARNEEFRAHAILNMSGTSGRQRVPSKCFDSYQIVVPTKAIAEKFGEIVKLLMMMIKKNDEQSRSLVQMRDALLPKLMSGEITVVLQKSTEVK